MLWFNEIWKKVPKVIKASMGVFFVCFGLLLVITCSLIIPHFSDQGETNADAVIVLVTSNTHMYMALRIAKKNGYTNISGLSAHTPKLFLLNGMFYESLSIVKNTVLGRM